LVHELFRGYPVHWVVDQAEFATHMLFTSHTALRDLYQAPLRSAVCTFTPKEILGFLGRKWDRRFDGEVNTPCEDDRYRTRHHRNCTSSAGY
jgi:hypothetical protein